MKCQKPKAALLYTDKEIFKNFDLGKKVFETFKFFKFKKYFFKLFKLKKNRYRIFLNFFKITF